MQQTGALEKQFDSFFSLIGFERVSVYTGDSPSFKNADYVRHADQTIVELKLLEKNFFHEGGTIDRFHSFISIPNDVDETGRGLYFTKFPPPNREGTNDTFEEPLRKILKNANRQIKETKKFFFKGQGIGIAFFAINGFTSLTPNLIMRMLCELLCEEFTSTDCLLLCKPNASQLNIAFDNFCTSGGRQGVDPEIRAKTLLIGEAWRHFFDTGGHRTNA